MNRCTVTDLLPDVCSGYYGGGLQSVRRVAGLGAYAQARAGGDGPQRVAMRLDDSASSEDESALGRPQRKDRRRCWAWNVQGTAELIAPPGCWLAQGKYLPVGLFGERAMFLCLLTNYR